MTSDTGSVDSSEPTESRQRRWQRIVLLLALLLASIFVTHLTELLMGGTFILFGYVFPRSENLVIASVILSYLALVLTLCLLCLRLKSHAVLSFLCRIFLLLVAPSTILLAFEASGAGSVGIAMTGGDWRDYLVTAGALALVLAAAAGIKIGLELQIRYWIVLLVVLAIVLLAQLIYPLLILTS